MTARHHYAKIVACLQNFGGYVEDPDGRATAKLYSPLGDYYAADNKEIPSQSNLWPALRGLADEGGISITAHPTHPKRTIRIAIENPAQDLLAEAADLHRRVSPIVRYESSRPAAVEVAESPPGTTEDQDLAERAIALAQLIEQDPGLIRKLVEERDAARLEAQIAKEEVVSLTSSLEIMASLRETSTQPSPTTDCMNAETKEWLQQHYKNVLS